jgi:predicted NBD/HSP70 family sugar kinase
MSSLIAPDCRPAIVPPLEPTFLPASLFNRNFRQRAARGSSTLLRLALERSDGSVSCFETRVFAPDSPEFERNFFYVERIVKFLLWQRGGWKLTVGGPREIGEFLQHCYCPGGARAFDYDFMSRVYERPFTVEIVAADQVPSERESAVALGRHLEGCRVGFDLGASDRKASAVIEGQTVFSEEVPWNPRPASDISYHYDGIMDSIRRAASHLPRLDAVGGSAAGVYINNRVRVASLFRGIPQAQFEELAAPLFLRIREELKVPMEVVNDGEVTALAGSMSLGDNPVLGIALGSSQAAGYVNQRGEITGWLNELAFVPVDYRLDAPADEWSGDVGCGVQYFSQVGAIRVASHAGMVFPAELSLPEKLVVLQGKMQAGDPLAQQVYETLGAILGYGVAHYAEFYSLKHLLILGRVTTGPGGEILRERATQVIKVDFPELSDHVILHLPDEANRRVGQSIAAASLPALRKS